MNYDQWVLVHEDFIFCLLEQINETLKNKLTFEEYARSSYAEYASSNNIPLENN